IVSPHEYLFENVPTLSINGTLVFALMPHRFGNATLQVILKDDGGTENDGKDHSLPQSIFIDVQSVNEPPKFSIHCNERPEANAQWARPSAVRMSCSPGCFWAASTRWEAPFVKSSADARDVRLGTITLPGLPQPQKLSIHETERQIDDIADQLHQQKISELVAASLARPLEIKLASLRERFAHYVYATGILESDSQVLVAHRYLPSVDAIEMAQQRQVWFQAVRETERFIQDIQRQDLVGRGLVTEAEHLSERQPLEILLALLRERLDYYDYLLQLLQNDPACRISISVLENCQGCESQANGACHGNTLKLSKFVSSISPSLSDAADESQQSLTWEFVSSNVSSEAAVGVTLLQSQVPDHMPYRAEGAQQL
ncbi:MAG: hypothetical protein ACPIOQ_71525, partial [Promethearchaeia archaeon]